MQGAGVSEPTRHHGSQVYYSAQMAATQGRTPFSEIRDGVIRELSDRVKKRGYKQYLLSMKLRELRSFRDASIRFDFPVTALVGPNGAGKTTVLGAAGLIYNSVKPSRFFAKSGKYDEAMKGWRVEYQLLSGTTKGQDAARTASYLKAKWNRTAVRRPVKVIGISRTLPVGEKKEVYKFVGGDFKGFSETEFPETVRTAVERILGKEAANYLRVDADKDGKYSILAVKDPTGIIGGYSEFHFGAGEASIIRIVGEIESTEENALILIEELENGLHPIATRRLVEYLIEVARRKSCQVIFTTHSNDALKPLPGDAVWSAYKGKMSQGKLDIAALRTLTGEIEARLAIFTEDSFGALVAEVSLRQYARIKGRDLDMGSIEIHGLGGAAPARDHARYNNLSPTKRFDAICFLDGDKRFEVGYSAQPESDKSVDYGANIVHGPGDSEPEAVLIDWTAKELENNARLLGRLTLALQMDVAQQERVRESLSERRRTNIDRHVIFSQIGEDLDYLSADVTARAFVSTWANADEAAVVEIWSPVDHLLPFMDQPAFTEGGASPRRG